MSDTHAPIGFFNTMHQGDYAIHCAVVVSWEEIERILGHGYAFAREDHAKIVAALVAAGAPRWVEYARLSVDPDGWYLIGPARS